MCLLLRRLLLLELLLLELLLTLPLLLPLVFVRSRQRIAYRGEDGHLLIDGFH